MEVVSVTSSRIAPVPGSAFDARRDPRYQAYFKCFNARLFFEAHEALEPLWLSERGRARDRYFKGLIQFAAAYLHLEKNRREPAVALFRSAHHNLKPYSPCAEGLHVEELLREVDEVLRQLESPGCELRAIRAPRLSIALDGGATPA